MSGIVAAALSGGCCCRPQSGCLCTDPTRPGAVVDRSMTAISVACDINYAHEFMFNGGSLIGFCGDPCSCRASNSTTGSDWDRFGDYGYRRLGNRFYQDLDERCLGCSTTSCAGCSPYSVNGSLSGAILNRVQLSSDGLYYQFRKLSTQSVFDQSIASWNWTPFRVGTCVDPSSFPWRMRAFCENFLYALGGGTTGVLPAVVVDPNGAYVRSDNGEYASGRWDTTIGRVHVMYSILVEPPNIALCKYRAQVDLSFMSVANIRDTFADCGNSQFPMDIPGGRTGLGCGGSPRITWLYEKPCASPSDTVFGTYALVGPQDIEEYSQAPEDRCGRTQWYNDMRASVGPTLTIS